MGRAIVIGGEKGGTGKSTLSVNLTIMLSLMNYDVILVDTDKQGSSRNFINHRNECGILPTPPCIQIRGKHLNTEIENFKDKYEFVIIDAGGKDSVELRSSMACQAVTDLYSPVQPSEFDLETLSTMDELTYFSLSFNPRLKTHIILNQCPTHSKITVANDAIDLIKEFSNLKIAQTTLGHRVAFSYSKSHHQSVIEFENEKKNTLPPYQAKNYSQKASDEIMALFHEIIGMPFSFNNQSKLQKEAVIV